MRIFLLANNIVGLEICKYLMSLNEDIVGLAIHMPDKQKFTEDIVKESSLPKERIFEASQLRNPVYLKKIAGLKPDIGIAAFWGYILKRELIDIFPLGCINFHPGYLPYNRGLNPNVWPFIEGTPAGVSLHYIDNGIDTGDIIARRKVEIESIDTAGTLYDKTLLEIVKLFKEVWPDIKKNKIKPFSQKEMLHTFHTSKDIDKLDLIDLEKQIKAKELINLLRARTYGTSSFAYFIENGKKINIGVFLKYKPD